MSHEIRTPMNGVVGMTELLSRTELTDQQRHYTRTIRKSAEALLGIINDILDFSKLEAGKLSVESIPFNLRLIVEEMAHLLAAKAEQKGLEFIVRYPPSCPDRYVGDPGRIRQVLANLLGNAIKFTEKGHVYLGVDCHDQGNDCIQVNITVEDTGIGIAQDMTETVFDSFTQADQSTTRKYGGTGLGLSITRQIVELLNGSIEVQSGLGQGSRFTVTLEMSREAHDIERIPDILDITSLRVLIVDDNPINLEIVEELLHGWGIDCERAASGNQALAQLQRGIQRHKPFHVAILDFHMPFMDGEDLARRIKADPALAPTKLVLLSSIGTKGDAKRLEQAGFSAYLMKPVMHSQLYDTLALLTQKDKLHRNELITRHVIAEARAAHEGHAATQATNLSGTILLVEDNPVNQEVASGLLREMGLVVDVADNGLEAVRAIRDKEYDLVFMDCQMPIIDGFEATSQIRELQSDKRRVPIVAMTAHAMVADKQKCLDAGMDDYLAKPVKLHDLYRIVHKYLLSPSRAAFKKPACTPATSDSTARIYRKAMEIFQEHTPKLLDQLATALQSRNLVQAKMSAHTLKGSAANLHLEMIRAPAAEIERLLHKEDWTQAWIFREKIQSAFAALISENQDNNASIAKGFRSLADEETALAAFTAVTAHPEVNPHWDPLRKAMKSRNVTRIESLCRELESILTRLGQTEAARFATLLQGHAANMHVADIRRVNDLLAKSGVL